MALGGYGRAELNPHSDIDIMFLHTGQVVAGGKPLPHLARLIDGILLPLFDLRFKVGHSVRTIADCVEMANRDMQTKTSLIEARFIVGDEALFGRCQRAIVDKCVVGHVEEYIDARLQDQAERRAKFGNSATMQEPNVKNGCGGLRDYQNLLWMAFFKHHTRSLVELEQKQLISAAERKQLEAGYDFLLRTRNELHYQAGRAQDVLTKALQPSVAHALGYTDRSPRRRLEKIMRDYFHHSRNLHFITRNLEERLALLPKPQRLLLLRRLIARTRKPEETPVVDGFKFVDGQIVAGSERVFHTKPPRLMRVFLHAQQRGLKLHPDLTQLMRHELALVNRAFLSDEHVRETFLEILNQRGNVAPVLRTMHEAGLLGKYLPEFGRLTCLVQHEFYHQYTADEHTLMCLEKLDSVWEAKQPPQDRYAELFRDVERPFVLYLALLLHDAGKAAETGRHADVGGRLALRVGKRLGLDGATTHSLRLLIEHHLLMTSISQRRDLEDPAVIRNFAAQVQTPENLRMLTLHSLADSLATSDKLWNGFKDSLLWTLHDKARQVLSGDTVFVVAEEKQRESLRHEVIELLPHTFSPEEVQAHFTELPPRYFQILSVQEIVTDLTMAHRFMYHQLSAENLALEPVVIWHNEPDRGYTAVKICTWDRAGLFSKLAGAFAATGINILSAQIFTRGDHIALDTFYVTSARTGLLVGKEERDRFEELLLLQLTSEKAPDLHELMSRPAVARPPVIGLEGERLPTFIRFDNDTSETQTVIEIETEDRLGLLYALAEVFSAVQLNISLAKINTEKGAAIDSFYLAEASGQKILLPERQRYIERQLRAAIAKLG